MIPRGAAPIFATLLLFSCLISLSHSQTFESDSDDADCLYESKEACQKADSLGCVWCQLPRRCYSPARSLELGVYCNRAIDIVAQGEPVVPDPTCNDFQGEAQCLRRQCRWCRSESLDDGCFSAAEALRLPIQIFECPKMIF